MNAQWTHEMLEDWAYNEDDEYVVAPHTSDEECAEIAHRLCNEINDLATSGEPDMMPVDYALCYQMIISRREATK